MKTTPERPVNPIGFAIVIVLLLGLGAMASHAGEGSLSETTFYVY